MRRLFAGLSLAAGALSILASVAVLRLWIFRSRATALYADNVLLLVSLLILLPLILVWLVVLRRRGRRWPALEATAFASTVVGLILLLALTTSLALADCFVRFEVIDGSKVSVVEILISR